MVRTLFVVLSTLCVKTRQSTHSTLATVHLIRIFGLCYIVCFHRTQGNTPTTVSKRKKTQLLSLIARHPTISHAVRSISISILCSMLRNCDCIATIKQIASPKFNSFFFTSHLQSLLRAPTNSKWKCSFPHI